jgi:hypothetical protein
MYNLRPRSAGCNPTWLCPCNSWYVGCRQWALTIPTLLVLIVVYSYWTYER